MAAKRKSKHAVEAWLEGESAGRPSNSLFETLDELYAEGPDEQAILEAVGRVRQVIETQKPMEIYYDVLKRSPVGPLYLAVSPHGLVAIDFSRTEEAFLAKIRGRLGVTPVRSAAHLADYVRQIREYLAADRTKFDLPIDLSALTTFQRKVLLTVAEVPRGEFTTYAELAKRIGQPKAARAVGQALGSNPMPLVLPCHRVLASDGSMGGYSGRGGVKTKEKLLRLEGARL
jgi:methylated-DNA-[protein]-cysteine S-methyltransferase